jgi:Domain of unknown function (DUF4398)
MQGFFWNFDKRLPLDSTVGFVTVVPIVSRPYLFGLLSVVAVHAAGCGPVQYIAKVGDASNAHAQAEREGAKNGAPYEFTAAAEYLSKAREEAGRSQFDSAVAYSSRSEEMSHKARALSRENRAQGNPKKDTSEVTPGPTAASDDSPPLGSSAPGRKRRGRQR